MDLIDPSTDLGSIIFSVRPDRTFAGGLLRSSSRHLHSSPPLSPVYGSDEMAAPLRRVVPGLGRALLSPTPARMLSAEASDALVEIKPGEIGMVSGIPEEHLRRKVTFPRAPRIHYRRSIPVFSGSVCASLEMFELRVFLGC
jgi:hypothetical protein